MDTNTQPKVALVAMARDEDRYIDEWLQYHLKLGFDRIVVIQNNWRYKGAFSDPRVVFIADDSPCSGGAQQGGFYTRWSRQLRRDGFDYMAAFDVDEFLVLLRHPTIQAYIQAHGNPISFYILWRYFGDNGLSGKPPTERSVLKRFVKGARDLGEHGKTMLNLRLSGDDATWVNPHWLRGHPKNYVYDAELYHFRNKTWEERHERVMKYGRQNRGGSKADFDLRNRNEIEDTRARDFLYGSSGPHPDRSQFPFDMAFVVDYTGHKDTRHWELLHELQKVGLDKITQIIWQFPKPYDALSFGPIGDRRASRNRIGIWSCTLGHYAALKTAYDLGCTRVLIMENDLRFIKKMDHFKNALHNLPLQWDVLMLESFYQKGGKNLPRFDYWRPITRAYGASCYLVNRRALRRMIECYEAPFKDDKQRVPVCDHFFNKWVLGWDYAIYAAWPPLAIQDKQRSDGLNTDLTTQRVYAHWAQDDYLSYPGVVRLREAECDRQSLPALLKDLGQKDLIIIEVGVYAGASTALFLSTGLIAKTYCVDPWEKGYDPRDHASQSNMTQAEAMFTDRFFNDSRVIKCKKHFELMTEGLPDRPDLIYIDANHTLEGVRRSIAKALSLHPHVIAGHDFHPGWPGVVKAVQEAFGQPDKVYSDTSWAVYLDRRTSTNEEPPCD